MDGGEPDIPIYKVIECTGPTNTRVYKVAVYFRGKRLASSTGHSIQQAEMEAAKKALENSSELFPQLDYQKRVMAHSMKRQKGKPFDSDRNRGQQRSMRKNGDDDSNLPKQYRVKEKSKRVNINDTDQSSATDAECSDSTDSSSHSNGKDRSKEMMKNIHKKHQHHHHGGTCNHELSSAEKQYTGDEMIQNESEDPKNGNNDEFEMPETNETENCSTKKTETADGSDTDVSLESGEIL